MSNPIAKPTKTTQHELTAEERHERLVAFLKRHMVEKRRFEEQMVEDYRNNKQKQTAFDQLRQEESK